MSDSTPPAAAMDSAELYHACRHGDAAAQEAAYRTLWRYLYSVAYQILRSQADPDALAQDCAQMALVRVHQRLIECQEPNAFKSWARRITSNLAIDELRRRKRLADSAGNDDNGAVDALVAAAHTQPERTVLAQISESDLRALLDRAPISARSLRVVVGRFLDDVVDEVLAQTESQLAESDVLPSHIQVTRSKNLSKLRAWEPLRDHFAVQT